MNISPSDLAAQYRRARAAWPFVDSVNDSHGLPSFLLWAVGSREANLDLAYGSGKRGDGGYGHGPWQLDNHPQNAGPQRNADCARIDSGDVRFAAETAAQMLADNYRRYGDWVRALAAYNSGSPDDSRTTGHDYGADTWARRNWLAANTGGTPVSFTPDAVAATNASQLGYHEGPGAVGHGNITKFWEWYRQQYGANYEGEPWCGCFQMWCAAQNGHLYPANFISVAAIQAAGRSQGRYDRNPRRGDLGCIGNGVHVFFLESVDGGVVHTIEGNEEDQVERRTRSISSIDGFYHPPYETVTAPPPPVPPPTADEDDMAAFAIEAVAPGEHRNIPLPPPDHSGGVPFGGVYVSFAVDFGDTRARIAIVNNDGSAMVPQDGWRSQGTDDPHKGYVAHGRKTGHPTRAGDGLVSITNEDTQEIGVLIEAAKG